MSVNFAPDSFGQVDNPPPSSTVPRPCFVAKLAVANTKSFAPTSVLLHILKLNAHLSTAYGQCSVAELAVASTDSFTPTSVNSVYAEAQ